MKHSDFKIGTEFQCGGPEGGRWRCTDIGTRVIVAISLDPHSVTHVDAEGNKTHSISDDPRWLHGPPYAVVERVFDEYAFPDCRPLERVKQ